MPYPAHCKPPGADREILEYQAILLGLFSGVVRSFYIQCRTKGCAPLLPLWLTIGIELSFLTIWWICCRCHCPPVRSHRFLCPQVDPSKHVIVIEKHAAAPTIHLLPISHEQDAPPTVEMSENTVLVRTVSWSQRVLLWTGRLTGVYLRYVCLMMKSMYFESQYLYDMSRLFYLRSILRNCWSRKFFLIRYVCFSLIFIALI
jgi:hypothetical protein